MITGTWLGKWTVYCAYRQRDPQREREKERERERERARLCCCKSQNLGYLHFVNCVARAGFKKGRLCDINYQFITVLEESSDLDGI